ALRELAWLGVAIERHFGRPQDVEWVWTGDKLCIVQARPITALPAPPARADRGSRRALGAAGELFPIRPYPFDLTTYTNVALRNVGAAMTGPLGFAPWRVDRMFREEDGVAVDVTPPDFRLTPRTLVAPWLHLWRTRRYDPARWREDRLLAAAQARVRQLEARDLRSLSWRGVLATIDEALAVVPMIAELRRRYYLRDALAAGALWLLLAALGQRRRFGRLLGGVQTKTSEANRALAALADEIRREPALARLFETERTNRLPARLAESSTGRAFLADLDCFLDAYGHRETAITVASQPTWKDEPTIVLGLLQGLARAPRAGATGRPDWEIVRDQVLASPLVRLPFVRRVVLRLLASARRLLALREDTHFYMTLPLPAIRRGALELGRRLTAIGVLAAPDEIFHLRLAELKDIGRRWPLPESERDRLHEVVRRRAAKRASLRDAPLVDPRLLSAAAPNGPALAAGTPGSPGLTEGPVRLIRAAAEFGRLQPGDVLVAPYTNPAWTPLFQQAAAVVVDTGGAVSHAAIVAREYGIPAVMGTGDAT
ncbi:MAG TPA: PEP-utilizing enzyme, partial [Thermomicrobiales bacterium]|nr:PEP-utilizing enzyme [Thermomicrobiales bacterium]